MLTKTRLAVVAVGLLLTNLGLPEAQAQKKPDHLVTIETGELPIILSAPHGGGDAIPGVRERLGEGVASFNPRSDSRTDELTELLADALEKKLGKRPYVVIARFHRKYLDANRKVSDAYESEQAKPAYDTYHQALTKAREEVIQRWGHGLLIDVHGQASQPKAIFRGTQNGKTTTHLVNRFGQQALRGETSLFGRIAKRGLPVIPAVGSTDREHRKYDGGFIVWNYGSRLGGTLDSIQLEVGKDLRSPKANPSTASKLADAITAFANDYLPQAKISARIDDERRRREKVHVGVYCDKGTGRSLQDLKRALRQFDDVSVKELMADDIRTGALAEVDLLIQPGGSGGGQGRHLGEDGRTAIRSFVRDGGGFIGICAGAYLASADYEWSLNILDAKVLDRKHWARGHGNVEIGITDAGQALLKTKESQLTILYWQGPLLAPANRPEIEDYEVIATFDTEIAQNGAPKGVMKGTTAIAKGQYGKGRVVCFSPHPELTEGLEYLVEHAIDYVNQNRPRSEHQHPSEQNADASGR